MREVSSPSVAKLSQMLEKEMERLGYSTFCIGATQLLSQQLSIFMEENAVETYDRCVGAKFQDDYCQRHTGKRQLTRVKLFIARINSIFNERGFVAHRKLTVLEELPVKLDRLLSEYTRHCAERGNYTNHSRENRYAAGIAHALSHS